MPNLTEENCKFTLRGKKLQGSWILVRTHGFGSKEGKSWLLIKHKDEFASKKDAFAEEPRSVLSRRLLVDIAREEGGNVMKASTGDPHGKSKSAIKEPKKKKRGKS